MVIAVILVLFITGATKGIGGDEDWDRNSDLPACPQYPALVPLSDDRRKFEKEVQDEISSDAFFDRSLKRMQGAIRIPTESFDDMGEVGEDPRWDIFVHFHDYLETTFPLV